MKRIAVILLALVAACGSSKSDSPKTAATPAQKVGDPAGQRAFTGSFRNGAVSGTCAVLIPPAGTGPIATTGGCSTGGTLVNLSGNYTATLTGGPREDVVVEGVTAGGALTITGTGPGGTWTITGSIGAGSTVGLGVLFGGLSIGGAAPVTLVLSDGTVDPLTSYCGNYYTEQHPYPAAAEGSFILQVNAIVAQGVSASTDGTSGSILMGFRSDTDVTLNGCDLNVCGFVGTGTVSASAVSGNWRDPTKTAWTAADRGLWSGVVCPGATQASISCCGSAAKTRCCIGTGCTCTPAP